MMIPRQFSSRAVRLQIRLVVSALLFVRAAPVAAQLPSADKLADSVRIAIESAVDAGEPARVDDALALVDRALAAFPDSPILLHYRAYALYRAGTAALGTKGAAHARPYYEKARVVLEELVQHETIPESYALLASVYGMQIAVARFSMLAGIELGPKSTKWMDRAIAAAPRNPRVLLMKGIGDFHTPKAFGGGMDKAEAALKQALALFSADQPAPPLPSWGLADAHIWLGQVYSTEKKRDAALAQYDSARALQPRNGWITKVLIPAAEKIRP